MNPNELENWIKKIGNEQAATNNLLNKLIDNYAEYVANNESSKTKEQIIDEIKSKAKSSLIEPYRL